MRQWDLSHALMQYMKNTNSVSSKHRVDYLHAQSLLQMGSEAGVSGLKLPKMHFITSIQNTTVITAAVETSPFSSTNSMTS